ncbi:MAG: hypothetical protein LBU62_05255 [Bacteroidales bacterium]|jgi:hypothetical protein|nr:hypothetical protein [Bacteroidales bacterium]
MEVKIFKKNRLLAWLGYSMVMRRVLIPVIIGLVSLCFMGCPHNCLDSSIYYCIYITGDTGRIVEISYPAHEKSGSSSNIIFTKSVILPFFEEIFYIDDEKVQNIFLDVVSKNDSTTRAIIFDANLSISNSTDSINQCWSSVASIFKDIAEDCDNCNPCEFTKDSALNYLKNKNFGYLEFSQGDTHKRVKRYGY